MALHLLYNFTPSPYPIRASVDAANPNTVDLRVTINPRGIETVSLHDIQIQIPVGADLASDLSEARDLPQPTDVAGADGWTVSSQGSVVTLLWPSGNTGVSGPISFTLVGIAVNETPGTVPIAITEFALPDHKVRDDTTYSLFKHPANFPVSSFRAEPAELYDLDQTVTLYWACTGQGADMDYSLSANGWQPRDCLDGGVCFRCADGAAGVGSPQLQETTTFTLSAIRTVNGHRAVVAELDLRVPLRIPSVSPLSYATQLAIAGGQILDLHWLALDAGYCSVKVDGKVVADRAPADTYLKGFRVTIGPGEHDVDLVAHALTGPAAATHSLGEFTASAATAVSLPVGVDTLAVAGASLTAWVGGFDGDENAAMVAVELATARARPPVTLYFNSGAPLLSADAAFLSQVSEQAHLLRVVEWNGCENEAPTAYVLNPRMSLACFTYDDAFLVMGGPNAVLQRVNVQGGGQTPAGLLTDGIPAALAPAGTRTVLAALPQSVAVVDVAAWKVTATIPLAGVTALAATADGSLAVAVANGAVVVIDLVNHAVLPGTLSAGAGPWDVDVLPDGKAAFVANHGDGTLTMLDPHHRRVIGTLPVPAAGPSAVVVSSDGKHLAVGCRDGGSVVVFPVNSSAVRHHEHH